MSKVIARYVLVLGIICLVSSAGLAGMYFSVKDRIDLKEASSVEAAQKEVIAADGKRAETVETVGVVELEDGTERTVVVGKDADGGVLGYATVGTARGYSSLIVVMVGVSPDLETTLCIKVLKQQETPGLGARMTEKPASMTLWQALGSVCRGKSALQGDAQPQFQAQFTGKTYGELQVTTGSEANRIVAMTGATISSKAVTSAVREAFDIIRQAVGQDREPQDRPQE